MKRYFWVVLALVMVVGLVFTGRAQSAASPAVPAPAAAHAKAQLTIWSGPFGGSGYTSLFAVMDTLNKTHPWLSGTILETKGGWDNHLNSGKDLSKRSNVLTVSDFYSFLESQDNKVPQMRKQRPIPKGDRFVISAYANSAQLIVTQNPNIKTGKDLVGKKLAGWTAGSGAWNDLSFYLSALGVSFDQLKSYDGMAPDAKITALKDGLVDAVNVSEPFISGHPEFRSAGFADLLSQPKPLYYISVDPEAVSKVNQKNKAAGLAERFVAQMPAGYWSKHFAQGWVIIVPQGIWVWKECPQEIQYEIAKTLVEQNEKITAYGGQAAVMVPDLLVGGIPKNLRDQVAPGALQYYKEKGLIDKFWK